VPAYQLGEGVRVTRDVTREEFLVTGPLVRTLAQLRAPLIGGLSR
jgi:hypothetical protein